MFMGMTLEVTAVIAISRLTMPVSHQLPWLQVDRASKASKPGTLAINSSSLSAKSHSISILKPMCASYLLISISNHLEKTPIS